MLYMSIALFFPYAVSLYYDEDPRPWIFPLLLSLLIGPMLVTAAPRENTAHGYVREQYTGWLALTVLRPYPAIQRTAWE